MEQIPRVGGIYSRSFGFPGIPVALRKEQFNIPTTYEVGPATVRAPGGVDVAAHTASIDIPPPFVWRNREIVNNRINRSQPLLVEYGAQGFDYVNIRVFSAATANPNSPEQDIIGALFCAGNPNADSFTIPAHALSALPRSATVDGTPTGFMWVGGWKTNSFSATGIEFGTTFYSDTIVTTGLDIN